MSDLNLKPNEQLIYFLKLEEAVGMFDVGFDFVHSANCIVTDTRIRACGISNVTSGSGETCFELEVGGIAIPEVQSTQEEGVTKYLVEIKNTGPIAGQYKIRLFPLGRRKISAEELAAQIMSAMPDESFPWTSRIRSSD